MTDRYPPPRCTCGHTHSIHAKPTGYVEAVCLMPGCECEAYEPPRASPARLSTEGTGL